MFNRLSFSADLFRNLNLNQKMALALGAIVVIIVVTVAVSMATQPHYVQLYGNLTDEDAAVVTSKLKEKKVLYRLQSNGHTIEVPENAVDETRLQLASEGIPQGGNVGFELFDKMQIGQSEFGERLNYLRALQGELSRTIGQLRSVRSARVHLALPEHRLYSAEEKKPSASVVLDLKSSSPDPREIKAIIHMVSAAVEGLEPAAVTVVDTQGNLLSDTPELAEDGNSDYRMQAQRQAAKQIEERVQSMLDRVLGPNKAIARASVKLNFDSKQVERELYSPAGNSKTQGIVESEHHSLETYDGQKPGIGGAVGVVPNTSVPATPVAPANGNNYKHEETTVQCRVSKEVERVNVATGQCDNISLAVFVDSSVAKDQLTGLEKTIATAAGIDAKRGDQIVVQPMAFDTSVAKAEEQEAKKAARTTLFTTIAKYGGAALLTVLFLLVLMAIYRSTLAPVAARLEPEDELSPQLTMLPPADMAIAEYAAMNNMPELSAGQSLFEEDEAELPPDEMSVANIDPQRIAQVIKALMADQS